MTATTATRAQPGLITPVLIGGAIILMMGFAIRASFGVFQIPIATEFGWPRIEFSLAIAIQNLAWGIGQPVFAAIGERFGDRKAIILGALVYAAGLILSAYGTTPGEMQVWNILIGCGVAGTGFGVILAMVGRAASDEHRSMTLGIATAAGSAGQIIGPPSAQFLLGLMDWPSVFMVFAGVILACLLLLPMLSAPEAASKTEIEESMGAVLTRAVRDPNYTLIFLGFFSCGYQLAFVTAHFPAFVTEMCAAIDTAGREAGQPLSQEDPSGADLYRAHRAGGLVHHGADDPGDRDRFLAGHGVAVAGHRAADRRADRLYLRAALYGDTLRDRVLLAPDGQFPRRVDGGQVLRHLWLV
jgi:MFS family permease